MSSFFHFFLSDRPEPPHGIPRVSDVTRNAVRLDWDLPGHDGCSMITCYIIEKQEGTGSWQRCGCTHLTRMTVHRLRDNKLHRFRVSAENLYGISDASEESEQVLTTEPKIDIDYDKLGKETFRRDIV